MIEIGGCCSAERTEVPEASAGKSVRCPQCGKVLQPVAGESLPEGAGAGDFDAALVADEGSSLPIARYLLGGATEISIGKSPECNIVLAGKLVSRRHCKLVRVDFGPSRWTIVDEKSTNGLFVNRQRVSEHDLADGDTIQIGEFGFTYRVDSAAGAGGGVALEMLAAPSMAVPYAAVDTAPAAVGENPMATAGMILGFIICIPICGILAIVFSAIGLSKSKHPGVGGRKQAITGLTFGIVGLLFVPMCLLISILLPALNRAREQANRIKCQSNMRMIGLALQTYENANGNAMPPSLDALAQAENLPAATLICPDGNSQSYVLTDGRVQIGGDRILLYEPMSNHHDGINVLFGDGSVKFMPNPAGQQIIDASANQSASSETTNAQSSQHTQQTPMWAPIISQPPSPPQDDSSLGMPDGIVKTDRVGGNGGSPYLKADSDKRIVIGFVIQIGSWSGHPTIGHCDPLWTESTDPAPPGATVCLAKHGYGVGGIVVNKVDGADGIQIIFMKLTSGGVDVNDSYLSDWFGDTDGSNHIQLAGHGERIIGTFGRQGLNMDAIGLLVDSHPGN